MEEVKKGGRVVFDFVVVEKAATQPWRRVPRSATATPIRSPRRWGDQRRTITYVAAG